MIYQHILMTNVPRAIRFPFPVHSLGYIQDSVLQKAGNRYRDKLEFCIRLRSDEEVSLDTFDGVEQGLPFPHAVVKAPDVEHCYEVRKPRDAFYFIYRGDTVPLLEKCGIAPEPFLWSITLTSPIRNLIAELRGLFPHSQEPEAAEQIDLLCFALLEQIIRFRNDRNAEENFYEKKIRSAASWLQLHYREPCPLETAARRHGLSKRTFFRHWKRYFKETPHQWILTLRLKEAKRLLRDTDRSVFQIAEDLNIRDPAYLVRLFRKRFGITPQQYRKKM